MNLRIGVSPIVTGGSTTHVSGNLVNEGVGIRFERQGAPRPQPLVGLIGMREGRLQRLGPTIGGCAEKLPCPSRADGLLDVVSLAPLRIALDLVDQQRAQ